MSLPCEACGVPLQDRDAKVMSREHLHARNSECIANLRAERDRLQSCAAELAIAAWLVVKQPITLYSLAELNRALRKYQDVTGHDIIGIRQASKVDP